MLDGDAFLSGCAMAGAKALSFLDVAFRHD